MIEYNKYPTAAEPPHNTDKIATSHNTYNSITTMPGS